MTRLNLDEFYGRPSAGPCGSFPTGCTQFGRPPDERGGEACDVSIVEPVDVVVLWILFSCGAEVSRELLDGDGRPQVVPQRGEQAGRRPGRAAEQGVDVQVVAGGAPIVEGTGFGRGRSGRSMTGPMPAMATERVLPVVLSQIEHDPFAAGGIGDQDLP